MTVNASGGTRFYIGGVMGNSSMQLADYQEDSYIEVGEVSDIGPFGDKAASIAFTALADSRTRKFKGARDAGDITVQAGDDPNDEGQQAMLAAEATHFNYNFKVVLNDALTLAGTPSQHYFSGQVMSEEMNPGNVGSVGMRTFTIGISTSVKSVPST